MLFAVSGQFLHSMNSVVSPVSDTFCTKGVLSFLLFLDTFRLMFDEVPRFPYEKKSI